MKKFISTILTLIMLLSMITIVQAADFSGGGYNFVCADGGRYLNVYAGRDKDGTNVCVWEKDGSPEQNYTISSCGGGKYKLYPACSSSRVIDVNRGNSYNNPLKAGLNVDLWQTNDAPAQEFYIIHVGNNLYKIELAALSGHVLQANNPGKNNGNVTLERYTGASNQHWQILKNGTQVTEPCTHDSISVKNEKTSYEQKDDGSHTVIKTYDKVCNDCGKTIKSNVSETTTEDHAISNNKCSKCGYEVLTQTCTHAKTYENVKSYVVAQKDDTYHTVTDTYDVYCSDCDELIKKDLTRTYEEKHAISNDVCKKCSYAVPDSEASKCKHANTAKHMSENMKSVTSIKDDNQHTTVSYYNLYCADCQTYIEYDIPEIIDEDHKFVNNSCSVCNLEKTVVRTATVKDGLYNIKNASSGYMLNVYAGKDANGTKVTVWENDNSNDQKIYITHQGDGKYLLEYNASKNGRVVDVNRGSSMTAPIDEGDKIDIWTSNDPEAQLFYINDCGNGTFTFELASKPGYVIAPVSVSGARTNGSQLELKKAANADYQKWSLISTAVVQRTATVKDGYVYNTDGSNLNMRSQANTKSSIVTKIPAGSTITVTGDAVSGFYPVKYGNYSGYASSAYITFTKPTNATNSNNSNFIWPVKDSGRVTCVFGGYKDHYGLDIGGNPAGKSMEIVATKAGTVSYVTSACPHDYAKNYNCGCAGGYGRYIKINHGDGTETRYCHLRSISVKNGQYVSQGQKIGMMGTTGWSSGVHLHFEIRVNGVAKNPQNYIKYQ